MICNITFGNDPKGLADYIAGAALDEHGRPIAGTEDRARLIGSQGFGPQVRTPDDVRRALSVLRKDVALQASTTKPIERTVMHMSLAWHPGYQPSKAEVLRADKHFAQALGIEEARRIIWQHADKEKRTDGAPGYAHIHEAIGLVNRRTGLAFDRNQLREKAMRAALTWERENNQITSARELQHAIAKAVEASNHAEVLKLNRAPDQSIARYKIDRAAALGGRFGKAMGAYRAAIIADQKLEPFPHNRRQTYAKHGVVEEKQQHIQENRKISRNLYKAHGREERKEMFDKLKEEIRSRLWTPREARAVRGLYKDHRDEWHDMQDQAAKHYGDPPRTRLREIWDDAARRPTAQQIRNNRRDAERAIEKQQAPRQERETPALPSPREIPMPKLNPDPIDQVHRPTQQAPQQVPQRAIEAPRDYGDKPTWPGRTIYPNGRPWHGDQIPANKRADDPVRQQNQDDLRRTWKTDEDKRNVDQRLNDRAARSSQPQKSIEENWKRDLEKINQEIGKPRAEREEQGREIQDRKPGWRDLLRDKDEYWEKRSKELAREPQQDSHARKREKRNEDSRERSGPAEPRTGRDPWEHSRFPEKPREPPRENWKDKLARIKDETQAQKKQPGREEQGRESPPSRESQAKKLDKADPPTREQARDDLNAGYAGGAGKEREKDSRAEPLPIPLPIPAQTKQPDFIDELREKTSRVKLPARRPDDGMNRGPKR